jgi:hypothetical protein
MPVLADDDMVVHRNPQRLRDADDLLRHRNVRLRRRRVAARMIVQETTALFIVMKVLGFLPSWRE